MVPLPTPVQTYLDLADIGDRSPAVALFTEGAVVVDDGRSYRGRDEILDFLTRAAGEFDYTTTQVAAGTVGDDVVVTNRIEGNFPGGVVDLDYRFTLEGDLIGALTIAPTP